MSVTVGWRRENPLATFAKSIGMEVHGGYLVSLHVGGWIQGVIDKRDIRVTKAGVALKGTTGAWYRKTADGWLVDG